jgi:predicted phage-related endonuclease
MGQKELTATIERIKELEAQQDELTAELEGLKDTVKAYMVSQGSERVLIGGYKVSYTKYTMSRFDSKEFKEAHKDLYEQYSKKVEARRFTISK